MTSSSMKTTGRADAWAAYNALRVCRRQLGLGPGVMHSLQAILSFLPEHGSTIVHAANRTISERAACSDRSLRRHVGELEAAGLLRRVSSPNGKRYRLRDPEGDDLVFGLDVSPLLERLAELLARVQTLRDIQDRLRLLKQRILAAIHRRNEIGQELAEEADAEIRRELRRQKDPAELARLAAEIEATLVKTPDLSASDGQSVRHLQTLQKEDLMKEGSDAAQENIQTERRKESSISREEIGLEEILRSCPEAVSFAPAPIRSREDLLSFGWSLGSLAGIPETLMRQAAAAKGLEAVVLAVLCIVQRGGAIRNAPGYFRTLFFGPKAVGFSPVGMLRSSAPRGSDTCCCVNDAPKMFGLTAVKPCKCRSGAKMPRSPGASSPH